jgi:hypothetical protein
MGAHEITALTIRNHLAGTGTNKTVLVTLGSSDADGTVTPEVLGFQSSDDDPGLDHPGDTSIQAPGNKYALRYEGLQPRDRGWWVLTFRTSPGIAPLSISGPQAASADGATLGLGWLRLGPIDGPVQIGGTQQLSVAPAPLTVLGPIATNIRSIDAKTSDLYSVTEDESVLLVDASLAPPPPDAGFVVSLPGARNRQGRQYTVKKTDTKDPHVKINCTSGQVENDVINLNAAMESVTVVSDGTQWWAIARSSNQAALTVTESQRP